MDRRTSLLVALAMLVALGVAVMPATATTVVPLTEQDLAEQAVAIVIADVLSIASHWDPAQRQVFTHVGVRLHEVLKGDIADTELTLKQLGGVAGGAQSWILGSPQFRRGEKVLLFLGQNADGTLRVAHLYQGKFTILADEATGLELAYRESAPEGVDVRGGGGTAEVHALQPLRTRLRAIGERARRQRTGRAAVASATLPAGATEVQAFTFLGNPTRWFEPDSSQPVGMWLNANGEPIAPTRGFEQIRDAYEAWSTVGGSSFRYRDGGFTGAAGYQRDGVNAVSFNDPLGQMDPPQGCRGTLAIGGSFSTLSQTRTVNGTTFARILEGDVVFNSGWTGCGVYESYSSLAEIATHELGHVLGLGHSADPSATMYAFAHLDGRGASVRPDDANGLVYIYPGSAPAPPPTFTLSVTRSGLGTGSVTSNPAGISCGSSCSTSFASGTPVVLVAAAATGSTFAGWTGAGCGTAATCTVVLTANTTVSAQFKPLISGRPDLVETLVSNPPGTAARGSRFTVRDTVQNVGAAGASASTTQYFLSLSRTSRWGGARLQGVRSVPVLAAGGSATGSVTVTVPLFASPGTYFLLACADATNLVYEAKEGNNCTSATAPIQIR
jgi:uncharacterized repeat protein (TIGR02543 family)